MKQKLDKLNKNSQKLFQDFLDIIHKTEGEKTDINSIFVNSQLLRDKENLQKENDDNLPTERLKPDAKIEASRPQFEIRIQRLEYDIKRAYFEKQLKENNDDIDDSFYQHK